jgi:hypothetical protein
MACFVPAAAWEAFTVAAVPAATAVLTPCVAVVPAVTATFKGSKEAAGTGPTAPGSPPAVGLAPGTGLVVLFLVQNKEA